MENSTKKEFKGFGIWKWLNKVPAGTMFVPLVISAVISTICIHCGLGKSLWEFLGDPVKSLFGKTGQMLVIGLMLFCTGTMIKPHDFVEVGKRGIWIILARLVPAYAICAIVMAVCGFNGFAGVDFLMLTAVLTSANAALYMGIIQPYADNSDRATFPIMLICSMPLLPFIFISIYSSSSNDALAKVMQIISLLFPFLLGFLLGNLDPKIREVFKGGNAILLPFLGFQFGDTIDLVKAFNGKVIGAAILVTVIYWAVSLILPYLTDRYALKRPGYASIGSSSLAGVALTIPTMFANQTIGNVLVTDDMVSNCVATLAFVLLITNILDPFLVKWSMDLYLKRHHDDAVRVFQHDHPELLEAVYDENGNYKGHEHHHFHHKKHVEKHNENQ